jgi:hypothetical protein
MHTNTAAEHRNLPLAVFTESTPRHIFEDSALKELAESICCQSVLSPLLVRLLPVRHLHPWIEYNVLLLLKEAPFSKRDVQLAPAAGSCVDCPKRTGHNKLLFADVNT